MTDEHLTRIENALQTIAEHQAQQADDLAELTRLHKSLMVAVGKIAEYQSKDHEEWDRRTKRLDADMDRLTKNIDRFVKGRGSNGQ